MNGPQLGLRHALRRSAEYAEIGYNSLDQEALRGLLGRRLLFAEQETVRRLDLYLDAHGATA
jgi:hypothetical protein